MEVPTPFEFCGIWSRPTRKFRRSAPFLDGCPSGSQLVQHHAPWRNLTSKHLDAGASHMRCTRCKVQPGAPTTVMHQGAGPVGDGGGCSSLLVLRFSSLMVFSSSPAALLLAAPSLALLVLVARGMTARPSALAAGLASLPIGND